MYPPCERVRAKCYGEMKSRQLNESFCTKGSFYSGYVCITRQDYCEVRGRVRAFPEDSHLGVRNQARYRPLFVRQKGFRARLALMRAAMTRLPLTWRKTSGLCYRSPINADILTGALVIRIDL
jgi:hypothetical protein